MSNLVLALIAGTMNGLGDFFSKLTAGKISPYLAGILLSLFSAITVAVYLVFVKGLSGNTFITKQGFVYAALGGVAIGVGVIFFFLLMNRAAISTVQPIVKSAVVLAAVILGIIVLREKVSVMQIIGMLLSIVGIYFLTK